MELTHVFIFHYLDALLGIFGTDPCFVSSFYSLILIIYGFQKVVKEDGKVEPEFADAEEGNLAIFFFNFSYLFLYLYSY